MKLLILMFLTLLSLGVGRGLHALKDGFNPKRIQSLNFWVEDALSEEAKQALKQPFRYLGRGRQCFAFASEDGRYVLKFPRTDIYKTPFWAKALPVTSYRNRLEQSHQRREAFILNSIALSFQELREQTALLAVHLGRSLSHEQLTVIDKFGSTYHLPVASTPFILQRKTPLLIPAFQQALTRGDLPEAQKILDALLTAIIERASKGILNRDRSFLRNYGFDGEKAYQIDVGSFFRNPKMSFEESYHKSIRDSINPVQEWLSTHSPEMLSYLNEKIRHIL